MESELFPINEEELVDYVFNRLLELGYVVKRDDILLVLDLEAEYAFEKGIVLFKGDIGEEY